jgi:hypothetical protein
VETSVTVVIIFVIIAGMFLIHRLNAQHDERIGAFRYSDALAGIGWRSRKSPPALSCRRVLLPEAARHVAEILRRCFAAAEARSYPAGPDGGTRLHLTVDTTRMAEPVRSWLLTSQSSRDDHTQPDEI